MGLKYFVFKIATIIALVALLFQFIVTVQLLAYQKSPPNPVNNPTRLNYFPDITLQNVVQPHNPTDQSVFSTNNIVPIDLRDHGPDPETTIAFVGQPVVWTNNGTQNHTVTEGLPASPVYLPLILRGMDAGLQQAHTILTNQDNSSLFDSGIITPGGQFTYTFVTTGTLGTPSN